MLVYSANNENELAIAKGWFFASGYNISAQVADYMRLYRDIVRRIVREIDPFLPFVLSSPSNGVESESLAFVFLFFLSLWCSHKLGSVAVYSNIIIKILTI